MASNFPFFDIFLILGFLELQFMKFKIIFITLLIFFIPRCLGDKLIIKYVEQVAEVDFAYSMYNSSMKRCKKTSSNELLLKLNEVDFVLRRKTGYSLLEFIEVYGNRMSTKKLIEGIYSEIQTRNNKCSDIRLKLLTDYFLQTAGNVLISFSKMNTIFSLPAVTRIETDVRKIFHQKINSLKQIPIVEIKSLASALETGLYKYSLGYFLKVSIKVNQSIHLYRHIKNKLKSPMSYYSLAKALENISKKSSFENYLTAGKLNSNDAQLWLGNYFACKKDFKNMYVWLDKVKVKKANLVIDLINEIDEYGEPLNCIDGWPN
ncbi:MAG: hypothetical protein COB38_13270 [Gammaproteobacteria bacterium]|nr:MAG: hypothetical protein COB38_13270 [Gammaproteobacteria bacterium]